MSSGAEFRDIDWRLTRERAEPRSLYVSYPFQLNLGRILIKATLAGTFETLILSSIVVLKV